MAEKKKYDNTNRGMLFRVVDKETDKHPDLNGRLDIDGTEYWISGWWKKYTDKAGDERTGVSISLGKRVQSKSEVKRVDAQTSDRRRPSVEDDDVPF